ncbi:MAG TPA: zf-HC2 domain-containing protein [Candidatus Krumholzibacteria bacterium]|nr:zf-HC2 domain-containing protein [Candidatus Krumholzibacteria bacterium]
MACTRYQTDGMRLLDGEMTATEKAAYERHVGECDVCRDELKALGRVVRLSDELKLRVPDDEFWKGYWESIYRRSERNIGFLLVVGGVLAIIAYGIFRAVTSPRLFTYEGISVTVILVGLAVIFISVARERYHESRNDPYREVER